MRIAYVSSFSEFVGGGEYSLFDLMTHLPADVEPVLLVPSEGGLSARAEREGIACHVVPMPPIGPRSLTALWHWRKLISDIRPDVLHTNNSRASFYGGLIGRMMHVPILFHCRIAELDTRLDRWLVRLVDGVIANSGATAKRFSTWSKLRVWTVYNGVDVSGWHVPQHLGEKPFGAQQIMLFVARVSRWKRHDIALNVFERFSDSVAGLHLVCVGGSDPMDVAWWNKLQADTKQLPLAERVHWLGNVERNELGAWYASADVLLLPSDDEPFGRVLVEAMSMGVPIVAFDGGGIPEVVQDGKQGCLVSVGDVDSMTAAVGTLLGDATLRREMGESGRQRAREFSVERYVEKISLIYREFAA